MHTRMLILFLFCVALTHAQELKYPLFTIDPALKKDAAAVVRKYEFSLEIHSLHSETITTRKAVTILKGDAAEMANAMVIYNNWSDVERFEGAIYDGSGRLIRKLGRKDIQDMSAIENGILYSEERAQVIRPLVPAYPYTVEYEIRQSFRKMLAYPTWIVQPAFGVAVESATLTVDAAEGLLPRSRPMNLPQDIITGGDGRKTITWEMKNIPALTEEPLCPPVTDLSPLVMFEPAEYDVKGYIGNFSSWKSLGAWHAALNEGRGELAPETITRVRSLVDGVDRITEKVQRIYRYMQSTCRYVAVNTGISGIQPEKAETVARLGYGDCKGLVNYTQALLKAAGIPSFYTLVRAGRDAEPVQADFPGDQFNHIILCVPAGSDTIWLECTSMRQPFGFLGNFTDDRAVLLVTPEGGKLTRTPVYPKTHNTCARMIRTTVDSQGNATVSLCSEYRGLQVEPVWEMKYQDVVEQMESAKNRYKIPGVVFKNITYDTIDQPLPGVTERAEATVPRFASFTGNRMFLPLWLFMDSPGTYPKSDSRKFDFIRTFAYMDADTLLMDYPAGYTVESLPSPVSLDTRFGKYSMKAESNGNSLKVIRRVEMEKGRFPASEFSAFAEYLRQISKADKSKIVLIKTAP